MLASSVVIALGLAAAAPPVVGLTLQPPAGLTDEETVQAAGLLSDELKALGMQVVPGPAVEPACAADSACLERSRAALARAPAALLVVEIVRIGPVLQVSAAGAAGQHVVAASEGLDEQRLVEGGLLPAAVRDWVQAMPRLPDGSAASSSSSSTTRGAVGSAGAVPVGALAAGALGAIAFVAGTALIATSEPVLTDPRSTGQQKQDAVALGWGGVAGVGVGLASVAAAVGLWLVE